MDAAHADDSDATTATSERAPASSDPGGSVDAGPRRVGDPAGGSVELAPLDPRVRVLWWLTSAAGSLLLVTIVATVDFLAPLPGRTGLPTAVAAALLAAGTAVVPVLRYRRWRYALRERDLWIRHGVLWVTVSVLPYGRIQFVDTRQGPLDRLFNLSQLVVHTAALGTSGRLPGLASDVAEQLRERLAEVQEDDASSV